jgi:hypothetical protein
MPSCTICSHPERSQAEALLAEGASPRKVAKQLKLSYQSLDRHKRNCAPVAIAKAIEARAIESGAKIVDRVEALHSQTLELLREARQGRKLRIPNPKKPDTMVTVFIPPDATEARLAIGRAMKDLELLAKLRGELNPEDNDPREGVTFEQLERIVFERRRKVTA